MFPFPHRLSLACLCLVGMTAEACSSSSSTSDEAASKTGGTQADEPPIDESTGGTSASGGSSANTGTGGIESEGSGGSPPEPGRPLGTIPNNSYPAELVGIERDDWATALISPTLEAAHHNQPHVINGYLQLTGNARFSTYDVSDPTNPKQISQAVSPDDCAKCGPKNEGEAEGHQVGFAKYGSDLYTATISGKGIDLWRITDPTQPTWVKSIHLEGVDFGDFTEAVWGVYWQGNTIYVGGTNTGLHVIDATEPAEAQVVKRVPTSLLGNVSAGPLYAVGNILVITTPKESGGIATLDISNPHNPLILDSISTTKSYIGAFYGHHAYLQSPVRAWDVLTNPLDIGEADSPEGSLTTASSEYMSFSDGTMFLGMLRPDPGVLKIDVSDPTKMVAGNRIWGRMDLNGNDDQFTVAMGSLLVLSDDQLQGNGKGYVGTVIAVHSADPDTSPPVVDTIIPKDGALSVSIKSRIGLSFTDNIELATVDAQSFIVRPLAGEPIAGTWGVYMGVLNFSPDEPLTSNTQYEVILPAGGIKDYVGNGLAEDFTSTFTTQ